MVSASDRAEGSLSSEMQQTIRDLAPDSVWWSALQPSDDAAEGTPVIHACFTPGEPGLRQGALAELLEAALAQNCAVRWRYVCEDDGDDKDVRACVWPAELTARAAKTMTSVPAAPQSS